MERQGVESLIEDLRQRRSLARYAWCIDLCERTYEDMKDPQDGVDPLDTCDFHYYTGKGVPEDPNVNLRVGAQPYGDLDSDHTFGIVRSKICKYFVTWLLWQCACRTRSCSRQRRPGLLWLQVKRNAAVIRCGRTLSGFLCPVTAGQWNWSESHHVVVEVTEGLAAARRRRCSAWAADSAVGSDRPGRRELSFVKH